MYIFVVLVVLRDVKNGTSLVLGGALTLWVAFGCKFWLSDFQGKAQAVSTLKYLHMEYPNPESSPFNDGMQL